MTKPFDRILALLNDPKAKKSMIDPFTPRRNYVLETVLAPVITVDDLDEAIMDVLEQQRPVGWTGPGVSASIYDDLYRRAGREPGQFRDRVLLGRIEVRLKELAKEGWVFWNKKTQRWEINEGETENAAAYSFHLDNRQIRIFEKWVGQHVKKCGNFPEVSGARWSFTFTPSGIVTAVQVKCLKCKASKDLT